MVVVGTGVVMMSEVLTTGSMDGKAKVGTGALVVSDKLLPLLR